MKAPRADETDPRAHEMADSQHNVRDLNTVGWGEPGSDFLSHWKKLDQCLRTSSEMKQGELCSEFVDPHSLAVSIRDRWMVSTHVETKHAPKVDHRYVFETVGPILPCPIFLLGCPLDVWNSFFWLRLPRPLSQEPLFSPSSRSPG